MVRSAIHSDSNASLSGADEIWSPYFSFAAIARDQVSKMRRPVTVVATHALAAPFSNKAGRPETAPARIRAFT